MSGRPNATAVGVLVWLGFALVACTGTVAAPTVSSTLTPTGSIAPTVTVSASASPSPTPAVPSPTADAAEGEMSRDQAVEVCLRLHDEYGTAAESLEPTGTAQVYDRTVEPHWLVLIPAENSYGPGYIECILGGPYSDPVHIGVGEMVDESVTDEYIERTRTVNEGL
ncbi:MAG: hypothetical protein J0I43_10525 [Microbacterium sp.]|uniref:hypothetical protein n=1 Tax=Microbacterium sp. TaxID=51671 RepID=UPI001AD1B6BA|nr:hypothetical protein [Microbacterium sp.]MBN9177789.1 hypothetical protein [Microbacterium sp.]